MLCSLTVSVCCFRLHDCNVEEDILPEHLFYNEALCKGSRVNLLEEWHKLKEAGPRSQVFNFCDYMFLVDDLTKYRLIQSDMSQAKNVQVVCYVHVVFCGVNNQPLCTDV